MESNVAYNVVPTTKNATQHGTQGSPHQMEENIAYNIIDNEKYATLTDQNIAYNIVETSTETQRSCKKIQPITLWKMPTKFGKTVKHKKRTNMYT